MDWSRWLTVILVGGGALIQCALVIDAWVHRRADGERHAIDRIERLEATFERIRARSSEDANSWQKFIGDTSIRLALIEQQCRLIHGHEQDTS